MMKNLPFIVLLCLAISLPPRLARAVDPATIAAVALFTSSVVSLFDSGASPTATGVSQIRNMLETLHERLETYDVAFLSIMEKMDDVPEIIRTELEHALDRDQGHALGAAIELIVEDVKIIETSGTMPLALLLRRLDALQRASRNIMQRNDLNLPYVIAALRTELAFIRAIGVSERRKFGDWLVRKKTYQRRLERVFQDDRNTPLLVEKANALQRHIADWMQPSRDEFRKVRDKIVKSEEKIELTSEEFRWLQEKHRPLYRAVSMYDALARDMPGDFTFDSYFTHAKVLNHIHAKQRHYVGALKLNRKVVFDGREQNCEHTPPVFRYRIIHTNDAAQELTMESSEDVKRKEANRTIVQEELLLLYRYMIDYARYAHALLSDGEAQPPKKLVERPRPYLEALKGFAKEVQEYADSFPRQQVVERRDGSPSGCRYCTTVYCDDEMLSPQLQ